MSDVPTLERRIRELRERFPDAASTAPGALRIDRRRFLLAGGEILAASLLAACNSYGPRTRRGSCGSPSDEMNRWNVAVS